jgi:hypothetical protein
MFSTITREVSERDISRLKEEAMENTIPYSLGIFGGNGTKYQTIRYKSEDQTVRIQVLPEAPTQTVSSSEDVKVNCYAVVVDDENDTSGVISTDKYENFDILPTLRQAFHEGKSFKDREADYRYHFNNGDNVVAVPASNPVQRLEDPISITSIEFLGGFAPKKWLLETSNGDGLYLRERSGSIRLYNDVMGEEEIFNAYIGREHPGTPLKTNEQEPSKDEIIRIITSVNYINLDDNISVKVSEDIWDEYHSSMKDTFGELDDIDFDDASDYILDDN